MTLNTAVAGTPSVPSVSQQSPDTARAGHTGSLGPVFGTENTCVGT